MGPKTDFLAGEVAVAVRPVRRNTARSSDNSVPRDHRNSAVFSKRGQLHAALNGAQTLTRTFQCICRILRWLCLHSRLHLEREMTGIVIAQQKRFIRGFAD